MAVLNIPRPDFVPHPIGRHEGVIVEVRNLGVLASQFGPKHKVEIVIESTTATMTDGRPFRILKRFNLSSNVRSSLRAFREAVLGRALNAEEQAQFDPDLELIGKRISFRVDHAEGTEGGVFANLRDGSVEPVNSRSQQPVNSPAVRGSTYNTDRNTGATRPAPETPKEEGDDVLPF